MKRSAIACFVLFANTPVLLAHALNAECQVKGGQVEVKATFDDGTHPHKAKATVLDFNGDEIAQGETDNQGLWRFPVPANGKYRVIVDAGAGHRTETIMTIDGSVSSTDSNLISSGPTEEEFIRFKWLEVIIGIAAIVGFCVVLWVIQRSRKPKACPEASGE